MILERMGKQMVFSSDRYSDTTSLATLLSHNLQVAGCSQ
jgi:hypothetical protein